jgi:hypothetical protein
LSNTVLLIAAIVLWLPLESFSQDQEKSPIPLDHFYAKPRKGVDFIGRILKNVNFGISTGYGNTFFSHQLPGFGIYQAPGGPPQIFSSSTATRYGNWVNDVTIDRTAPLAGAFIENPGTSSLGFKGNGLNIPLQVFLYYGIKDRYRIGAGYSYELMSIGSFQPTALAGSVTSFQPTNPSGFIRKYYGFLGYSFYRWNDYLFTGDFQIGDFKPTPNFNAAVTGGMYYNLGVTIERDLSEYFKVFARPSFEIKSYVLPIPESGLAIDHSMNAFYINIGVTYRIPELPRCFLKDCHVQINHAHGNREYRSRRHPVYKKQNPGYGENDKTLIKYKGKNKRKLNPY